MDTIIARLYVLANGLLRAAHVSHDKVGRQRVESPGDNTNYEGHYQQLLYVIFSLLGRYVDVEVRTSAGRVDMVMRTGKALYLFELKLNRSAGAAMRQIDLKDYASRFALCGLPVVKVAIRFDAARHTIGEWQIEG